MLASSSKKFVFLSNPKTGTTSLERALKPHSEIHVKGHATSGIDKHITYLKMKEMFGDYFEKSDCKVFTVIRDPVETLVSWYRFRSREKISNRPQYTGNIAFEQFAKMWNDCRPPHDLPTAVDIALKKDGSLAPICYYRYRDFSRLTDHLSELVGEPLDVPKKNLSPAFDMAYDRDEIAALPRMEETIAIYKTIEFQ